MTVPCRFQIDRRLFGNNMIDGRHGGNDNQGNMVIGRDTAFMAMKAPTIVETLVRSPTMIPVA
jgi:hypothetical protein